MKNTLGYRIWKVAFFAVFTALIVFPYIKYELEGILTAETRFLFISFITLLTYGLILSLIHLKDFRKYSGRIHIDNIVPVAET